MQRFRHVAKWLLDIAPPTACPMGGPSPRFPHFFSSTMCLFPQLRAVDGAAMMRSRALTVLALISLCSSGGDVAATVHGRVGQRRCE